MDGKLYIDGKDAYSAYGVYIGGNSLGAFVQYAAFKPVDSTDWPEEDGEEYDLTAPVLDARTMQVPFCITDIRQADIFFDALADGAYHTFDIPALGRQWKLRMTANGTFAASDTLGKFTLTFSDDFPNVPDMPDTSIPSGGLASTGYSIDGVDMAGFGLRVLQGTRDGLLKAPQVKAALGIGSRNTSGIRYDGTEVLFKPKDITMQLLLKAPSADTFWLRYDALFSTLLQPGTRMLGSKWADYDCFYYGQRVTQFHLLPGGGVWCGFSLTLRAVSPRPAGNYLLATEASDFVTTEDGARIPIRARKAATASSTASTMEAKAATDNAAQDTGTSAGNLNVPMGDMRKKITELPESTDPNGLYTIGVDAKNESVKVPIAKVIGDMASNARYTNIPYAPSGIAELDMGYAGTDAAEVRLNAATGNLVIIPQSQLGGGGGIVIPSNIKGYKAWNGDSDLQNGLSSEGYKRYGSEIYVGGDIWQFSGMAWAQINGAGQGKVYTKQDSALTWTIAHNMGKRPAVSVVNAAGYEVECDVRYIDDNTVLLTFATVFFGKAILN